MNRLEKKLNILGYSKVIFVDRVIYFKWVNVFWRIDFEIEDETIKDVSLGIGTDNIKKKIYEDEPLLNAYKEMQKDIKYLKRKWYKWKTIQ